MAAGDTQGPGKVLSWLLQEWTSRLSLALQSMTGVTPVIQVGDPVSGSSPGATAPDPAEAAILWWQQPFQPIPDAVVWVGTGKDGWSAVGDLVLRAAGVEDASTDDLRGTYLEVIRQALSGVAQALAGMIHADVLCDGGEERARPLDTDIFPIRISFEGTPPIELSLAFSPGLARQPNAQESPAGKREIGPAADGGEEPETSRTMDLLYDVELPVSVSFGRAHLPLREVLKLTSGSIVELNRTVTEPVEVIVNNCVIARGEVVVVDGNYGVRINQIISRRERLRTLY